MSPLVTALIYFGSFLVIGLIAKVAIGIVDEAKRCRSPRSSSASRTQPQEAQGFPSGRLAR